MITRNVFRLFICLILVTHISSELCTDDICEYNFLVQWRETMTYYNPNSKKTLPVRFNGTDLILEESTYRPNDADAGNVVSASDVITADGRRRDVIVINGQLPGPTIEVLEGAQILVHVTNALVNQEFTLHWHGLHQHFTPFMDGAHGITQCGIGPGQTYSYRFEADPAGTHWYHSHVGMQMVDGGVGMIVVHKNSSLEQPYHEVMVTDWYLETSSAFTHLNPNGADRGTGGDLYAGGEQDVTTDGCILSSTIFQSALLNFRGRFAGYDGKDTLPLQVFQVEPGKTHRFRMVSTSAEFSFEISVDHHKLTVVASDGHEIQPVVVDSMIIGRGDRLDFELTTDQPVSQYWFRATTLRCGTTASPNPDGIVQEARAVVSYTGPSTGSDPISSPRSCTQDDKCVVLGCPWPDYANNSSKVCLRVESLRGNETGGNVDHGLDTPSNDVMEIFLNAGFTRGSTINGYSLVPPKGVWLGRDVEEIAEACSMDEPCESPMCKCIGHKNIPLGKTVQMVLTNYGVPDVPTCYHHSMHLHGYSFAVLAMGYAEQNSTSGHLFQNNKDLECKSGGVCVNTGWAGEPPQLNLDNPIVRDTIIVPPGGYVVTRFKADSPGYWLLHCHQVTHHVEGMGVVLNVGPGEHPPVPSNQPTCADFEITNEDYDKYKSGDWPNGDEDLTLDHEIMFTTGEFVGIVCGTIAIGCILTIIVQATFSHCKKRKNVSAVELES